MAKIEGTIAMDGVPLSTEIFVLDAETKAVAATGQSTAQGDYSIDLFKTGDYYVMAIPPEGYRPLIHGPVFVEFAGDPHWLNVVALLRFDGGIADETERVWTVRGTEALIETTSARFGTAGLRVDGIDSSVDSADQLGIVGAEPLTIEGWMRIQSYDGPPMLAVPNLKRQTFFGQSGSGSSRDQIIYIESGLVTVERTNTYAGTAILASGINIVPLNEFFHIAYTYDGAVARAFINGVKEIEIATANGWADTGYPMRIGANLNVAYPQYRQGGNADIDEFRITKGVCRYTENFTPPTAPFPGN